MTAQILVGITFEVGKKELAPSPARRDDSTHTAQFADSKITIRLDACNFVLR